MFRKIENKIEGFYNSHLINGKLVIPNIYKEIAVLLIAVLEFVKLFTSEKIDKIIDEIIRVLKLLNENE